MFYNPYINFTNENEKFLQCLKQGVEFAESIKDLNKDYNINVYLVGGCLRDIILNKNIKDIDVCVEISEKKDFFTSKEKNKDLFEIVKNKINNIDKVYKINTDSVINNFYETMLATNLSLMGIIKLKTKDIYPMDIMITNNIKSYIELFDFEICKISLDLNLLNTIDIGKILLFHDKSLDDLKNNKITYNAYQKTKKQIDYSFENHFKRIKDKYPNFKLNFTGEMSLNFNYAKIVGVKTDLEYKIDNIFEEKNKSIKRKKI